MVVLLRTACLALAIIACAALAGSASAQQGNPSLSKDDKKLLESLLKDFLFDPKGAERVRVVLRPRTPWQPDEEVREGWLVKAKSGDRVYFTDGDSILAPHKSRITKVPFLAKCVELYDAKPDPEERRRVGFRGFEMPRPSGKGNEEPTLVLAAWLYRLGEKFLAAQVMAHAPEDRTSDVELLRRWLADSAFIAMVECFSQYHDRRALEHGERLLRLYPAEAACMPGAEPLVQDLRRRQSQGMAGKKGKQDLPKGFDTWDANRRLAFLIESLDETQVSSSTVLNVPVDAPRLAALLDLGEAAVPSLLDVLEKDDRMTRCIEGGRVHFGFGGGRLSDNYAIETTRDVALALLRKILRVEQFDTRELVGADRTGTGDPQEIAKAARAYWTEFGHLPFEERMMRVLRDPFSNPMALLEATVNLAGYHEEGWDPMNAQPGTPTEAVLRFEDPTVAQAMLRALDRTLAGGDQFQGDQRDRYLFSEPRPYFAALIQLGDRRIATELADRAAHEKNGLLRLRLAHACHRLGHSEPLRRFAVDFAVGKVALSLQLNGFPSHLELNEIVQILAAVDMPEAERALFALAKPGHRLFPVVVKGCMDFIETRQDEPNVFDHPSCVSLIRRLLDDKSMTKVTARIDNNRNVSRGGPNWGQSGEIPACLSDPKKRKDQTTLRLCDFAGEWARGFAGLPEFHPLLNDADDRLATMRDVLKRFDGRWRKLTDVEKASLGTNEPQVSMGPDIPPLGRPADAEDVKSGRAIFHLHGQGKRIDLSLPARATLKVVKDDALRHCLIVQAEMRPDGEIVYGIIHRHAIRTATESELTEIMPLNEFRALEKTAAQKQRLAESGNRRNLRQMLATPVRLWESAQMWFHERWLGDPIEDR